MAPKRSHTPGREGEGREEQIARIVAECSDRLNAGERVDLDGITAAHPDLAPDLAECLEGLRGLGQPVPSRDSSLDRPSASRGPEPRKSNHRFLQSLRDSGLLPAGVPDALNLGRLDEAGSDEDLARRLVEKEIITPYQAEKLLQGQGQECVLAGRFLIEEELGSGGMGTVYRARDTKLDRRVAVKVLAPGSIDHPRARARFDREAKALAQLSHPNIVQAYDSGEEGTSPFLVMEYIEGESLADLLKAKGRIPPPLAADYAYQAALGLDHAHRRGLVHRDLKPSNLLLTREDRVKILDLGLARFLADHLDDAGRTREGLGLGTPDYMAPEQFRDARNADERSDIYSLGATLYHLLTGQVPFPGSSLAEKTLAHEIEKPRVIEDLSPETPRGLILVVSRMMAKRPADRFRSAREAARALLPYVAGSSKSLPEIETSRKWRESPLEISPGRKRWRMARWAVPGGAVGILLLLFTLFWHHLFPDGTSTDRSSIGAIQRSQANLHRDLLTVAQDGTGDFRSIREALAATGPGATIRVLDDGVYEDQLVIDNVDQHAGVHVEAPRGATIALVPGSRRALFIQAVPGLLVKGFRFRNSQGEGGGSFITVALHAPGVVLEDLDLQGSGLTTGIELQSLSIGPEESPVVVRKCKLQVGLDAVTVSGPAAPGPEQRVSRGASIRENFISRAARGIDLKGAIADVHITANVVWNCGQAAIQIDNLAAGSRGILIANNTAFDSSTGFRIWDDEPYGKHEPGQVVLRNNVFFGNSMCDVSYRLHPTGKGKVTVPGDGEALIKLWTLDHNARDFSGSNPSFMLPLAPGDRKLESMDILSRDPSHRDFLRPARGSALASEGAGKEDPALPPYIGAVPPEGAAPWDWANNWKDRATTAREAARSE